MLPVKKTLWALPLLPIAALAACSDGGSSKSSEESVATMDVAEPASIPSYEAAPPSLESAQGGDRAPDIAVTAAPGVAFDYRYAYRLPSARIGEVQERHAAACEKLGVDQCRIVGLRYNVRDEDNITAMLALKLAPERARDFGKQATAQVEAAEGMMVAQEISGTDAGARIDAATRAQSRIEADIARLEKQLEGLADDDRNRGTIVSQIAQLRRQLRATEAGQDDDREALAQTPMVFHYGAGEVIPGFDRRGPIEDAFARAWWGFQEVIAFFIVLVGTLLPIALLASLVRWVWMRTAPANWRRRIAERPARYEE